MDPKVKEFLAEADAYILRGAPERQLERLFYPLTPVQLQEALAGFIDVSAHYPMGKRSQTVFWMLASTAVARGSSYYALELEYRIRPDARTAWPRWFSSLPPDQQQELRQWIGKKKASASEAEKTRLWTFKRSEEDADAAKKATPAPDKRATSATVKNFLRLFHGFMAGSVKQTALADVIMPRERVLTPAELEACLEAYVGVATQYSLNAPRSLYVFEKVSSLVLARCSGYFTLKFDWRCLSSGQKSTWSQLYANLRPAGVLDSHLKAARKRVRILDELKFSYFKVHDADPTFDKLRRFEPPHKPEMRNELLDLVHFCLTNARKAWIKSFGDPWDRLAAFYSKAEPLDLVLMLKWCREKETTDHEIQDELYWLGVGILLEKLMTGPKTIESYRRGFDDEEKRFFLASDAKRHPYFGDFELRLLMLRKRHVTEFVQISKAQALIHLYARKRNLGLATIAEAARVYDLAERFLDRFELAKGVFEPVLNEHLRRLFAQAMEQRLRGEPHLLRFVLCHLVFLDQVK